MTIQDNRRHWAVDFIRFNFSLARGIWLFGWTLGNDLLRYSRRMSDPSWIMMTALFISGLLFIAYGAVVRMIIPAMEHDFHPLVVFAMIWLTVTTFCWVVQKLFRMHFSRN